MTALGAAVGRDRSGATLLRRKLALALALVAGAILFGLLAGSMVASGKLIDVFVLLIVFVPVALWKHPQFAPALVVALAVLIDQLWQVDGTGVPGEAPGVTIPITGSIPFFRGLGSAHLQPSDLLLLIIAVIFFARTDATTRLWPRTHLRRAVAWYIAAVLVGIFVGLSHHGTFRVAMMEARPFIYFGATYILTAVLIRGRSALRAVLWTFVVAVGIKAAQTIYLFLLLRHLQPRPNSVIGHEVAYIFGVFLFLVAALWIFDARGPLRKTATWLVPVVIIGNLVNDRRAAWLLLGGGVLTLSVIAYRRLPERRAVLRRTAAGLLVFSAVYFPAYWNKVGTLAQPARAAHSQVSPDPRDASSDLYRIQEDANLKYNIRQGGLLGKGFGVPIDYALPIVDISKIDPNIKYVPHNGVLYVLMRIGILGAVALWSVLGTGIVAGCRLARSRDREIAVIGAVVVCSLIAYALEGATDMGFYFDRIALLTGVLLGLAEAARRIHRATVAPCTKESIPVKTSTLLG